MQSPKQLQTIANTLLDSLSREQVAVIAEHGYAGATPGGMSADDLEDFREVVQNTAVCMAAGAVRGGAQ
jgi:hypothetical protein